MPNGIHLGGVIFIVAFRPGGGCRAIVRTGNRTDYITAETPRRREQENLTVYFTICAAGCLLRLSDTYRRRAQVPLIRGGERKAARIAVGARSFGEARTASD